MLLKETKEELRPDNKPRCPTSTLLVVVMPPHAFPLLGSRKYKYNT
jgi:hypothetical protein